MAPNYRECSPVLHRKRTTSIASRLPEPPRLGEILIDVSKNKWRLGRCIGVGAFGEVYLASDDPSKPVGADAEYVVKIEPHSSGPLFVEMNFYIRAAKHDLIEEWKCQKKKSLGVPAITGFGNVIIKTEKYRFIVMPRYGENIQELFLKHSKRFHIKTAFTIAWHTLNILEYIHSHGYLHLDLKGLNFLLSRGVSDSPLYVVDYGLVARYLEANGSHKPYKLDNRHAEVGTLEYSSRDAHIGVMSRRSDLESLGFNLVHWMSGTLPWLHELGDSDAVYSLKEQALSNVKSFIMSVFPSPPQGLVDYMMYVSKLRFDMEPDYEYCRQLFSQGIRDAGFLDDNKITFDSHAILKSKNKKRKMELENDNGSKRIKLKPMNGVTRKPCAPQNINFARVTRNQVENGIKLRSSRDFDWAEILAGHPERRPLQKEKIKKEKKSSEIINNLKTEDWGPANFPQSRRVDGNSNLIKDEDIFANPTPAMIKVINRRKLKHPEKKWARTENLRESYLTPEMREVIANRRRVGPSPKVLRHSKRKQVKLSIDAMFACTKF